MDIIHQLTKTITKHLNNVNYMVCCYKTLTSVENLMLIELVETPPLEVLDHEVGCWSKLA